MAVETRGLLTAECATEGDDRDSLVTRARRPPDWVRFLLYTRTATRFCVFLLSVWMYALCVVI